MVSAVIISSSTITARTTITTLQSAAAMEWTFTTAMYATGDIPAIFTRRQLNTAWTKSAKHC